MRRHIAIVENYVGLLEETNDPLSEFVSVSINGNTQTFSGSVSKTFTLATAGKTYSSSKQSIKPGRVTSSKTQNLTFDSWVGPNARARAENAYSTARSYLVAKQLTWLLNTSLHVTSSNTGGVYWCGSDTVSLDSNEVSGGLIIHELGHRFHYQCSDTYALNDEIDAMYLYYMRNDHSAFYREYAKKDRYEFWADSFRLYVMNQISQYPQANWTAKMIQKYNH